MFDALINDDYISYSNDIAIMNRNDCQSAVESYDIS